MMEAGWKQYDFYIVELFFCKTTGVKKRIMIQLSSLGNSEFNRKLLSGVKSKELFD